MFGIATTRSAPWVTINPARATTSRSDLSRLIRGRPEFTVDTSTVITLAQVLQYIESRYQLADAPRVWQFIRKNRVLADVLVEALSPLERFFGPDPHVALKVIADPEVADSATLFAYIQTPLPAAEALARLNEMDEQWFLDQLDRAQGLLNFNLEFL